MWAPAIFGFDTTTKAKTIKEGKIRYTLWSRHLYCENAHPRTLTLSMKSSSETLHKSSCDGYVSLYFLFFSLRFHIFSRFLFFFFANEQSHLWRIHHKSKLMFRSLKTLNKNFKEMPTTWVIYKVQSGIHLEKWHRRKKNQSKLNNFTFFFC